MDLQDLMLDVDQHIQINAAIEKVFEGLLNRLSKDNTTPEKKIMPMTLERKPGGRWFRDLGEGVGHLWGFVQVIKPPTLLEITGPMFMSYPVAGHLQVRLESIDGGTRVSLRHRAFGCIEKEHREGVSHGWGHYLSVIKSDFE